VTPRRKRGRPSTWPADLIISVRAALARGEPVAKVARDHHLSRRYVRDILAGARRPDAVEVPPEIEALAEVPGQQARDVRELWGILALAAVQTARR